LDRAGRGGARRGVGLATGSIGSAPPRAALRGAKVQSAVALGRARLRRQRRVLQKQVIAGFGEADAARGTNEERCTHTSLECAHRSLLARPSS
jgi:hypothetical protein